MNSVVQQDIEKSRKCFIEKVAPIVIELLKSDKWTNEIKTVEGQDNEICKLLDCRCGTDYVHIYNEIDLVWGIASRIQYQKNWRTFTIRSARDTGNLTELAKRKMAIENGGYYPYLTCQAYIADDGEVDGLAIMRTKDLIHMIDHYPKLIHMQHTGPDQIGGAEFMVINWDDVWKLRKTESYKILGYKRNREDTTCLTSNP